MYRAFNLRYSNTVDPDFVSVGKDRLATLRPRVLASLEKCIREDGSLDGTRLRADWFPDLPCSVFISHSHRDEGMALGIAGWLFAVFEIDAFVDSGVWGHADALLRMVDDRHCRNPDGDSFSYEKRNRSTAHVHALLSTALTGMLDRSECVVFLNTSASVPLVDSMDKTTSPWIYSEVEFANRLRRRPKESHRGQRLDEAEVRKSASARDFQIYYDLQLQAFSNIDHATLSEWRRCGKKGSAALDRLYDLVPDSTGSR